MYGMWKLKTGYDIKWTFNYRKKCSLNLTYADIIYLVIENKNASKKSSWIII